MRDAVGIDRLTSTIINSVKWAARFSHQERLILSLLILFFLLLFLLLVRATSSKNFSNRIAMKFGSDVLPVNTHRLTEPDFSFDVIISKWRRHDVLSRSKVLCCHLASENEASGARICNTPDSSFLFPPLSLPFPTPLIPSFLLLWNALSDSL